MTSTLKSLVLINILNGCLGIEQTMKLYVKVDFEESTWPTM